MAAMDLAGLKDYVNRPSGQEMAASTVTLNISHSNLKQQFMEIRFDLHTSIERVKERLRSHTGTSVDSMRLELYDSRNSLMGVLADDFRPLGFYSPAHGYRLHVIDLDPTSLSVRGGLEDTSLVQKYTISDDAYSKREGTYLKFKEQKIAQDPTWTLHKEMAAKRGETAPSNQPLPDDYMADLAEHIKVGDRCEVGPGERRGSVAYVGAVAGLPAGWWVGVRYDEPSGRHDGEVNGKRYFQCPPGYGAFIRPDKVKVGDYPEHDPFDDDPDEI